ncbi:hypothetical protein INR49_001198 [Caranx melampygus]|nr:hypothetical protein INR49_001198 [Caranx melampygus]
MTVSSPSLLLGPVVLLLLSPLAVCAVFLSASPNRLQFLPEESVSLRCEGHQSFGWTVKRTTQKRTQTCGKDFGIHHGSSCIISDMFSWSDSGVYWCENNDGQKSPEVTVSVSDVILEIPLLPVIRGSDVTLRCRAKDMTVGRADFFMNGDLSPPTTPYLSTPSSAPPPTSYHSPMTDHSPSTTPPPTSFHSPAIDPSPPTTSNLSTPSPDPPALSSALLPVVAGLSSLVVVVLSLVGGLFLCRRQTGLLVQLLSGLAFSADVLPPLSVPVHRVLCHLVVICPYCVSTILMISIYCSRRTGNKPHVSIKMNTRVQSEEYVSVSNDVTTEHDF